MLSSGFISLIHQGSQLIMVCTRNIEDFAKTAEDPFWVAWWPSG